MSCGAHRRGVAGHPSLPLSRSATLIIPRPRPFTQLVHRSTYLDTTSRCKRFSSTGRRGADLRFAGHAHIIFKAACSLLVAE